MKQHIFVMVRTPFFSVFPCSVPRAVHTAHPFLDAPAPVRAPATAPLFLDAPAPRARAHRAAQSLL